MKLMSLLLLDKVTMKEIYLEISSIKAIQMIKSNQDFEGYCVIIYDTRLKI